MADTARELIAKVKAAAECKLKPRMLSGVPAKPQKMAAAEGLTNKEIGARLFLSPKTVEFHLSHAYRKLDVRARGELIKLFAEQAAAPERLPA